jgi:hypothetical protein
VNTRLDSSNSDRAEALLVSISSSIASGHWKVAARRYLLALACNIEVPFQERLVCDEVLARFSVRERRKIEMDTLLWLEFVERPGRSSSRDLSGSRCSNNLRSPDHPARDKHHDLHAAFAPLTCSSETLVER